MKKRLPDMGMPYEASINKQKIQKGLESLVQPHISRDLIFPRDYMYARGIAKDIIDDMNDDSMNDAKQVKESEPHTE